MIRSFLVLFYYAVVIPVVILAQRITEPALGGPGINFYTFILVLIVSLFLMVRSLRISVLNDKESYLPFYIHLIGVAITVYLIFFDHLVMARA